MLGRIWSGYIVHIVDILAVAYIFYRLLLLFKGTRATRILIGIAILGAVTIISRAINLPTLSWLLERFWLPGIIIVAIVFQPELRSLFIQLGTAKLPRRLDAEKGYVKELLDAISEMSSKKIGGIFVFEREVGLREFIESGTILNADITKELILCIFNPKSVLHDGAVIIQDGRIVCAGATLPLSENPIYKSYGTRHKSAVGISENSDAGVIVVSEETGNISIAKDGHLENVPDIETLRARLYGLIK